MDVIGRSPVSLEIEAVGSDVRNASFTTEVWIQVFLHSIGRLVTLIPADYNQL